jgi:hypothetical protein
MFLKLAIQSRLSIVSTAKRDPVRFLKKVLQKRHFVPVDCSFSADGAPLTVKGSATRFKGALTVNTGRLRFVECRD